MRYEDIQKIVLLSTALLAIWSFHYRWQDPVANVSRKIIEMDMDTTTPTERQIALKQIQTKEAEHRKQNLPGLLIHAAGIVSAILCLFWFDRFIALFYGAGLASIALTIVWVNDYDLISFNWMKFRHLPSWLFYGITIARTGLFDLAALISIMFLERKMRLAVEQNAARQSDPARVP